MTGSSEDWKYKTHPNIICLFDIDGTLTPARKVRENLRVAKS